MESFINTDTITDDEELLEALKHNNKVSSSMKQEIKEIEKLDEANKNMTFKKEKQCFEENDEYDEVLDEDMDYLYYYEPIKEIREDISIDELEKLIKENLPSKNNPMWWQRCSIGCSPSWSSSPFRASKSAWPTITIKRKGDRV